MYRRHFLGAALAVGSSGCTTEESGEVNPSRVTIGQLEITNLDDRPHEVTIELYANNNLVYSKTDTVGSIDNYDNDSVVIIKRDWPVNVDNYTFRGRVDNGEWRSFVFDEPHSKTCHIAELHITADGDYDIYYSTAGADEELCDS